MESAGSLNVHNAKKKQDWDFFAEAYNDRESVSYLQSYTTLAVHTKAFEKKRILEVGCGGGLHSLFFMNTIAKAGTAIFLTDISSEMLKELKKNYGSQFNGKDQNVLVFKDQFVEKIQVDSEVSQSLPQPDQGKLAYASLAPNDNLPFEDGKFEAYLCSLCFMMAEDKKRVLSECLRVLKPGSFAGFSMQGRRENCQRFAIVEDVFKKHGITDELWAAPWDEIGNYTDKVKALFVEAGFVNIRYWYQPNNSIYKDGADFAEVVLKGSQGELIEKFSEEEKKNVKKDLADEYERRCGSDIGNPNHYEQMIFIAQKP